MKNIPKKIYLQIGGSDVTIDKSTTDWNDLFHGAITWADHRINENDIEFVLSDVVGRSEQCDHDYSDGTGTGWNVCKKCGDMY